MHRSENIRRSCESLYLQSEASDEDKNLVSNCVAMSRQYWTQIFTKKVEAYRHCKPFSTSSNGQRLRVAVVGGGASGLSTALHLAPLVSSGKISGPIDIYDAGGNCGRDVGVGVWSTALDPFRISDLDSHKLVYDDMIKHGCFIRDVGYRTPKGQWLATSRLEGTLPDLLFLREKDMLAALRKAVHREEHKGTISLFSNSQLHSVSEESTQPWSAQILLKEGKENFRATERDYHLIVAADGMNSVLRKMYGGHICSRGNMSDAASSPLDIGPASGDDVTTNWYVTGQAEATGVQDRGYTVFRGISPLSMKELGMDKSFQTWGEGKSMRFATVPMVVSVDGTRKDQQVWFITIDDDEIQEESDPAVRRERLLGAFQDWHDPISRLVEATPPEDIIMERAMAHKHSMSPVANFNGIVSQIREKKPRTTGNGPAIVFVGDAFMTVDPILAQGFTFGMEGAAALRTSIESGLVAPPRAEYPEVSFDPFFLREELKSRHDARLSRLINLLRATELVQALGQPTTGTLSGIVSRDILRPLMRWTPDFIKTPIFNFMLRYSLGLPNKSESENPASPSQSSPEPSPHKP